MTTTDPWHAMLQTLLGLPVPPLPDTPGRRCRPLGEIPKDDCDPFAAAWDAAHGVVCLAVPKPCGLRNDVAGVSNLRKIFRRCHRGRRLPCAE